MAKMAIIMAMLIYSHNRQSDEFACSCSIQIRTINDLDQHTDIIGMIAVNCAPEDGPETAAAVATTANALRVSKTTIASRAADKTTNKTDNVLFNYRRRADYVLHISSHCRLHGQ